MVHAGGLSFHRARQLVLNPARRTDEEKRHIDEEGCRRCSSLIKSFERNMQHPSLSVLVGRLLGRLTEDEARVVKYHVEDGECQRCQGVTQSRWLRGLAGMVQGGRRTGRQVQAISSGFAAAFALAPAPVLSFGPARPPFRLRATSPDGSLTVTLWEPSPADLVVHVETPDLEKAGRKARVELVGEGEPLKEVDIVLEGQGDRCTGQLRLGSFAELAPQLGAGCTVLAALKGEDA